MPQVLSTDCERRMLITLIAGVRLQHVSAVHYLVPLQPLATVPPYAFVADVRPSSVP